MRQLKASLAMGATLLSKYLASADRRRASDKAVSLTSRKYPVRDGRVFFFVVGLLISYDNLHLS